MALNRRVDTPIKSPKSASKAWSSWTYQSVYPDCSSRQTAMIACQSVVFAAADCKPSRQPLNLKVERAMLHFESPEIRVRSDSTLTICRAASAPVEGKGVDFFSAKYMYFFSSRSAGASYILFRALVGRAIELRTIVASCGYSLEGLFRFLLQYVHVASMTLFSVMWAWRENSGQHKQNGGKHIPDCDDPVPPDVSEACCG